MVFQPADTSHRQIVIWRVALMCSVCHTLSMIRTGAPGSGEQEASVREERWKSKIDGVWSRTSPAGLCERPTVPSGRRHTGGSFTGGCRRVSEWEPARENQEVQYKSNVDFWVICGPCFTLQYSFTNKKKQHHSHILTYNIYPDSPFYKKD